MLVAAAALALCACNPYVQGNGVYYEENRTAELGPFVGLEVDSEIQATVTVDSGTRSIVVSGDANVVQNIRTEVRHNAALDIDVLHVWIPSGFQYIIPPRVVVRVPAFQYLSATGASTADIGSAAAAVFTIEGSAASRITLAAPAGFLDAGDRIDVTLSSGSSLDASSYPVTPPTSMAAAVVALSGASRASLRADGPVTGTISGGSVVDDTHASAAGVCAATVESGSSCCDGGALSCP